jgi:hypothetical protein
MDLSIVAAARFEVEPLKNAIEHLGFSPEVHLVGIGAINAAKNARTVAEACRGKNVVFVGTCGTFGDFSKPQLITGSEVHWLPTGDRMGFSYTVKDSAPVFTLKRPLPAVSALPQRKIICGPSVSKIAKLPDGYIPAEYVENLELYSCGQEIGAKAGWFSVVLCITNAVGPDSHIQWKENFANAATETAEFFKTRLKQKSENV